MPVSLNELSPEEAEALQGFDLDALMEGRLEYLGEEPEDLPANPDALSTWVTVHDGKVCEDCAPRHGQTKPDSEWDSIGTPGSGWSVCGGNCRCELVPETQETITPVYRPRLTPAEREALVERERQLTEREQQLERNARAREAQRAIERATRGRRRDQQDEAEACP